MDGEALREAGHFIFRGLSELQQRYGQRIVLEYDFFGEFEEMYVELFAAYPELMLVVDTQRLDMHARAFPGFDPYKWLERIAAYVYLVHYSNIHYGEKRVRHLPVLPQHADDPSYGDAFHYLRYLAKRNGRFHLTFEHNPEAVTLEELHEVYESAAQLMGGGVSTRRMERSRPMER